MEKNITQVVQEQYHWVCTYSKLNGKSGNPVFLIKKNHQPYCILKIFSNQQNWQSEIQSYEFLKKHQFKTVNVLKTVQQKPYFYLFLQIATGCSLAQILQSTPPNYDQWYIIGCRIASVLKTIHTLQQIDANQSLTENQLSKLVKFAKVEPQIKTQFLKNPGQLTYVHGDPSPDNFFVDDQLQIIIIDPGQLMKNTLMNLPAGFPACDYHRFLFSVKIFAHNHRIHCIHPLIDGFVSTYGTTQKIFTEEANLFFLTYWNQVWNRHTK